MTVKAAPLLLTYLLTYIVCW